MAVDRTEVLKEEVVAKYAEELKQFVVSHVDKHGGEGLIM